MRADTDQSIRILAVSGALMAITVVLSSFSIPVPGGHLYLCDIPICVAALLLDPLPALLVGGVGSFLGDLFFYPLPMFVSLVTHGIQASVISGISHSRGKEPVPSKSVLAVTLGGFIMVTGYTLGRAFIYSTPEYAWIKLPYEFLQAAIGAIGSLILVFHFHLGSIYHKMLHK